jgi:hypothetical protein
MAMWNRHSFALVESLQRKDGSMGQDKQHRGAAPQTKQQGGQQLDEHRQQADQCTPDKTTGQIQYAAGQDNNTKAKAGAGSAGQQAGAKAEKSQMKGPAAYAPHDEGEKKGMTPNDPAKQKS